MEKQRKTITILDMSERRIALKPARDVTIKGGVKSLGSSKGEFARWADQEFGADEWFFAWLLNTLVAIDERGSTYYQPRLYDREAVVRLYEDGYYYFFQANPDLAELLCQVAADVYEVDEDDIESGFNWNAQTADKPTHYQDIAIRRALRRLAHLAEREQVGAGEKFTFRGKNVINVNEGGDHIPQDPQAGQWAGHEWWAVLSPGKIAAQADFKVDFSAEGISLLNLPAHGVWYEDDSVEAAYQQRVLVTKKTKK